MTTYGLDLLTPGGGIADMRELGVIESYKLKKAVVSSASEAAEVSSTPTRSSLHRLIYNSFS
jgi:T-complex protein 1 subunit beta